MTQNDSFAQLIRSVRDGDTEAAAALWRHYEPLLRREVRLRLRDPRLRRIFDEEDVCQSVMASFFLRATAGEFELDSPEQLQRLLARMGRNKLASQVQRHQAGRRDYRRTGPLAEEGGSEAAGDDPSPSQAAVWSELLQKFRARLSGEERQLADWRAQGRTWDDIATELGGSADARRVQLSRALARVSRELGLDETAEI